MAKRQVSATDNGAKASAQKIAGKAPVASRRPATTKAAEKVADKYETGSAKKKVVRKTTAVKSSAPATVAKSVARPTISAAERERLIRDAAFLISTNRNPCDASPEVDWCQAEAVIDMIFDIKG